MEALPSGTILLESGTIHNKDPIFCFKNGGKQDVTICAVALVSNFLERNFTETEIDACIHTGDSLFASIKVQEGNAAAPGDLPTRISVYSPLTTVDVTENKHLLTHIYPQSELQFDEARVFLLRKLTGIFKTSPPNSGFLFGSPKGFVAFFETDEGFAVFEPQGVNEFGCVDQNESSNCSRLFLCESIVALTDFLLLHEVPEQEFLQFFTVVRMRFRLPLDQQRLHEALQSVTVNTQKDNSESDSEMPLIGRRPVKRSLKPASRNSESDSDTPLAKRSSQCEHDSDSECEVPLSDRLSNVHIQNEPMNKKKGGRPKKVRRHGRPATSTLSRKEQVKEAQARYREKNKTKVQTLKKQYSRENPEVHRAAQQRYTQENPEVHRQAQQRYNQKNPQVHRDAQQRYNQENPQVHRDAQQRYNQENPQVHRDAQQRFVENNPEQRRQHNQRYRATHPEKNKTRHLSTPMQKLVHEHGPMGFWSGDLLNNIEPHRLKKPNLYADDIFKCKDCGARLFEEESHSGLWCCGNGAYKVLDLPPLNAEFYTNTQFLDRARAYNDMMALCAMEVTGGYRHLPGLSFFKIEGRLYHKIYSLGSSGQPFRIPDPNQPRTSSRQNTRFITQRVNHCRLYIDDGAERRELAEGRKLSPVIIEAARSHLLANNPFLVHFRLLNDEPAEDARLEFEVNTRATHGPVLGDRNPGIEVHAVISTGEQMANAPRKLTVWKHADRYPTTISLFDPLLEPFQYPLLYPNGTTGWFMNMQDKRGKKLSQLKYTKCLLLSEPRFTELGRLSQAWMVEMYARIEEERLQYIARCQKQNNPHAMRVGPVDEIRASINVPNQVANDVNADLRQELANDETVQGEGGPQAGKIYLPSSFTGSPRYMKKKYMNAMGLVSRKGGPTYFLTFTACGQWDELKQSTRHGSKCDPATCCRIFHIKLKELLQDIRSGAMFGPQSYILWVIEMQMRGLPHAHIAIRMQDGGPTQARDIDTVIRADLPGPEEANGRLRELVLRHMVHGPCGTGAREDLPCWDKDKLKCAKFYPKPHTESTYIDDRGFVHYRRNHENKADRYYRNRRVEIHEGWVIPYNAALLLKYEAHINLEIASTRRVIKYLFKYLHKGGSHQNVRVLPLEQQLDEPEEYATKRMIGASDACWRMLGFNLTVSEPTVEMLPVHLEGKHSVVFRPGEEQDAVNKSSQLMLYMSRPVDADLPRPAGADLTRPADPVFDNLTYQAFYENFIIHTTRPQRKPGKAVYAHPDGKHYITPRERGECVTRMFWVSMNQGEQYYLRVLLSTLPCRGYADLMSKGGEGCSSFQEACRRLGLIDNEQEYAESLREASQFMVGPSLRNFFVMLANIGAPARILWDSFKKTLCEDLLERHADEELAYKWGLIHIDRCLRRNGSCLANHGLPIVDDDSTELGRQFMTYGEEAQRNIYEEWLPRLTDEQRAVLEHIQMLLSDNVPADYPKTVFLDGPGGYGKTALLRVITAYLRSQRKIPLCVAISGIAALNMEGGSTAHSMFRLPLDLEDGTGTWNITNGTQRAELVRSASLIIFDEAPMAHKHVIEMLDRSLQDLMGNNLPFGGKCFLCSGDYRQIPPIVPKARTPSDTVAASLRSSHLWDKFRVFKLTVPQRTRGSDEYSNYLLQVGNGTLPETTFGEGRTAEKLIPLTGLHHDTSLDDMINEIYPADVLANPDIAAERAILATLNINVRAINDQILHTLPNRLYEMTSYDEVDKDGDDGFHVDEQTLHEARAKGVPDHILKLKIGTVCLITRNLNIEQGLVNGTKVIVEAISPRLVRVRKAGTRETYGIPRITFKFPIIEGSPMNMTRRQFPLQLAYAMSFHKSQGQTILKVGVDLRTDCFTHGQLYVGLSRVRSPDDIRVLVPPDRVHDGIAYTRNLVYHDLLQE